MEFDFIFFHLFSKLDLPSSKVHVIPLKGTTFGLEGSSFLETTKETRASFLLNDEKIEMFLLAPIIDTYLGTSQYYKEEHDFPYDEVITRNDNIVISDEYPPINFLFCENANVSLLTFKSYLDFSATKSSFPFTYNIIQLLEHSKNPIMIFSGTDDEILFDSYKKITKINKSNIKHHIIDGGDHFFRDIFLDDVIEVMFE